MTMWQLVITINALRCQCLAPIQGANGVKVFFSVKCIFIPSYPYNPTGFVMDMIGGALGLRGATIAFLF